MRELRVLRSPHRSRSRSRGGVDTSAADTSTALDEAAALMDAPADDSPTTLRAVQSVPMTVAGSPSPQHGAHLDGSRSPRSLSPPSRSPVQLTSGTPRGVRAAGAGGAVDDSLCSTGEGWPVDFDTVVGELTAHIKKLKVGVGGA